MHPHLTFHVTPKLPERLEPLRQIVMNIWWSWEPEARGLFREINPELWHRVNHSPIRMLQLASQDRLVELSRDPDYLHRLDTTFRRFKTYLDRPDTYFKKRAADSPLNGPIAYFSAEFGFHESIPIYSGGLGILSGDHCKAASDLDLPFIGVTLLYRHGYFKQQINSDGWQEARELDQNFHQLPVEEVTINGKPLIIHVPMIHRNVAVKVWKMAVGRVTLYLLDTDVPENPHEDREITAQLYGGNKETRIQQEIILGMGGVRMFDALNIEPEVYHMNEGHSAFLSLERIRRRMASHNLSFRAALQVVAASNVFTTHTPVPAGNDAFSPNMMRHYFAGYCADSGISFDDFYTFGQATVHPDPDFSMTILALRTSRHANGVSALHGEVSREMWQNVWAGVPSSEVPISSVTNGVHTKTWLAPEFSRLFTKYLGDDWEDHITDTEFWGRVTNIPAEKLWSTHQHLKSRLVDFARERVRKQRKRNGETPDELRKVSKMLDRDILTIGFARRFATYKRATLLFSDEERLFKLLNHTERPVQFIFAGKAHPADDGGKAFIQKVIEFTRREGFCHRIAFIEDYDAYIGRRLYQGVDLWLNNPLRPLEASGTSGMKLPPNGGINLSVLDGWWCEAYNKKNGWAIGEEITDGDPTFQNHVDAASLYHLLESQIVPLYYTKPDGNLPLAWIQVMQESMKTVTPMYNTERMVTEYNERFYERAAKARSIFTPNDCAAAAALADWKNEIRRNWEQIRIDHVDVAVTDPLDVPVGDPVTVEARVHFGEVNPDHVSVEAYYGESDEHNIISPTIQPLERVEGPDQTGCLTYRGQIIPSDSGAFGLSVRVVPTSPHLVQAHELRRITWSH
ncbi:alpha-glucan family phosphorylase [Sulfuriroseicoccus oceanibius]|uniref:Alpha-glucan family phosphorylase n=1 Tax=Sulfuriroseicoccus oceanibius TaxID=2707525 RepID=A0A6B3L578_9BACT|nr:alpha-glucan family phosphorylase [Sulfuriroseicoccus oceanibius]QQL44501.1 alpha-glucan family phosphorylase [Sulfuriroseicoccus oceanibius]